MKMSQYIEENFMKSEDAFLTAEPNLDEDVVDVFEWDAFRFTKMEKVFEKLNKLMKSPFRYNTWLINSMNVYGNNSAQFKQILEYIWDVYNKMELNDVEIRIVNTAIFKIVKLTVDNKLDARKINISSVIK